MHFSHLHTSPAATSHSLTSDTSKKYCQVPQSHSTLSLMISLPGEWEAPRSCGCQTTHKTTAEHILNILFFSRVVIRMFLLCQTKAISETCQSFVSLTPPSQLTNIGFKNLCGRQMDRYSHPINFSSSGNHNKNSWSQNHREQFELKLI